MNKYDKRHIANVRRYQQQIDAIYKQAAADVAARASMLTAPEDGIFSFDDFPAVKAQIDALIADMRRSIEFTVNNGVRAEWSLANDKNDALVDSVLGDVPLAAKYHRLHDEARDAFLERKVNGLNLSDRVWKYSTQFKNEIELGLDCGIRDGLDAPQMARRLGQYLQHPDMLFRRVRDERGVLQLSKRAAAFHPGQGVYRSSYKNARRLAATETNIAYRTSDHERWKDLDFVVGIKISLSNNHTCLNNKGQAAPFTDICDTLAGNYPKDFKFTGWHPHCRCIATPILKTKEEIAADNERILRGEEPSDPNDSKNAVKDVPDEFNEWVEDNKERAKGWSTMPYFIRDNPHYVQGFEVDTYSPVERTFTRARRTSEAMSESLDIYLQSKYPEMPNTEKAAIYHYTQGDRSAFRQLNSQLRKGNLSEFNAAFSELLSAGLSKIEPIEATVYRTIRLNKTWLRDFSEKAVAKEITVFEGFTSTSLDRSTVLDFAAAHGGRKKNETDVLLVIQGKSGRPIEDFSQFGGRYAGKPNQREVLFDKGGKFRFNGMAIENGWRVFYLTEV